VKVLVGLDAGGTKLDIRAETVDGKVVLDARVVASRWEAEPASRAADWLLGHIRRGLPDNADIVAVGLGAQGCDSPETVAALEKALLERGLRAVVVNDGALLIPAAGLDQGIGIVAGTGSIAVGSDAAGGWLLAGGWGWVLGDEGGSAAVVREATKAVLAANDSGNRDDGLLETLQQAFGVNSAERLARAVNDEPTVRNWAPHAEAVFAAADAGSSLAAGVIEDAAVDLAALVSGLIRRGAVGRFVVAGGSVITRQPRLAQALRARLHQSHPDLELRLLTQEPVAGAVALARRLYADTSTAAASSRR
jgi:N-acetylglucosamine kinase-like BadF-type ATPase